MGPDSQLTERPASVCIRVPNWVGDVVMATPALRCVRTRLPEAHIALVVRDKVADVLQGVPWFDEAIVYHGRPRWSPACAREFLRCAKEIRRGAFELAMILPNSFSSALMMRWGRVGRRVGYVRDARRCLLTDPVERPSEDGQFRPTYMGDFYLALCAAAGLEADGRETELPVTQELLDEARAALGRAGVEGDRPLVLLHPGAGYGPSKLWREDRFAELADALAEELDAQVACIGVARDAEMIGRIRAAARAPVADLTGCGIDLHLLKGVVKMSALMVTTDSGPRHYGVALGVPTVCLMGATHPGYTDSGRAHDHVVRVEVECGPCQKRTCSRDHRCMERITSKMVLDRCRTALETGGGSAGD